MRAGRYHRFAEKVLREMRGGDVACEMRVRVDGLGIRGKALEVAALEGEVDRFEVATLIEEFKRLKRELEGLDRGSIEGFKGKEVGEERSVREELEFGVLVRSVEDSISTLQELYKATESQYEEKQVQSD